jgi:hypothetical protein
MSRTAETITKLRHSQELFLLLIVEQELSPHDAYAKAYPKCKESSVSVCASRLLANAKVKARKAELETARALAVRATTRVTAENLTAELQAIATEARIAKQYAAASAAIMGIAKIHGMLVEKHIVDAVVRRPSLQPIGPDEMTELEWIKEYSPTTIIEADDSIDILPGIEP